MSEFLYRGRHCAGDRQARTKSVAHMTDFLCDETEKGPPPPPPPPPLQTHSLREFEQHLKDLKKENFSLKLRIYFLEERIQQKYEDSSDDVHKRNIELKVEVESLKQELLEKQVILDKALTTAERLTNRNDEELSDIQEIVETKVKQLQKEAQLARGDAESQHCLALEREMMMKMEEEEEECEGGSRLQQGALAEKDRVIEELTEARRSLSHRVGELEVRVHDLSWSLQNKDRDAELLRGEMGREKSRIQPEIQRLLGEQQGQLSQYETAAGQCANELQKAQLQVHSLQAKIRESEARNQKLQVRLGDMECELCLVRVEAQRQERNVLNLADTVNSKETEAAELYRVIEEQNNMLGSLKELANRNQLQTLQVSGAESMRGQGEVLALQGSLFQAQLELQAGQRAQRQATRREEDLTRALHRQETDLQGAMEHRHSTERHNQDLHLALEKARSELQQREEQLKVKKGERRREEEERGKSIRELRTSLQTKEQLVQVRHTLTHTHPTHTPPPSYTAFLQEYSGLLDQQQEPRQKSDTLLTKLKDRIKDRDRALERAVDEKFRCVEKKEGEMPRLQLLLRDNERDLGRQRCVLSNNEETITESAGRLGEVMSDQTVRLQERRRQLTSDSLAYGSQLGLQCPDFQGTSQDLRALQEELCLALSREREAQAELTALRIQGTARPADRQAEFGELNSEDSDDDDDDNEDVNSNYADSMEEEDSKLTSQTLATMQNSGGLGKGKLSQEAVGEAQGLVEVKQLVQQKRVVERELQGLKAQLEKAGFSSLSKMRKALFSLRTENTELKSQQTERQSETDAKYEQSFLEEEEDEEELDVEEEEEELCAVDLSDGWDDDCLSQGKRCAPRPTLRDPGLGKRRCTRPVFLDLGALLSHSTHETLITHSTVCMDDDDDEEEAGGGEAGGRKQSPTETGMVENAVRLRLESKELQERLMVSEATVEAQAEQLKDYRDMLTETSVQKDSKQVQVDLQDMGYETCGRSENEAEREETSSPEFDDLEMCTSLECGGSQWWSGVVHPGMASPPTSTSEADDFTSLQRLVEDLRSQLSRSQMVIRSLQGRLRSLPTSSDPSGPSNPRKVNWDFQFQASPSQSGLDEDEDWDSSGGGLGPKPDKDLQELVSRVGALEDQLRDKGTPAGTPGLPAEGKAAPWPGPGKFDTLIQAQARELSHLRQRMREGRGMCHILTQHLGDTTKAFEELLRANDIDYYTGQSFREQLAQSSALAQRVSTKISGRDHPEIPDEKIGTELLAIRLSKELQQKDKVIESLHAKLNQHQPRSDTPCSSHALSDTTDQSDLELCSDIDAASEYGQEDRCASTRASTDSHCNSVPMSRHPSIPPSTTSSHGHQSSTSCPSMQPSGDTQTQTGFSVPSAKPLVGFPMSAHPQADPSSYVPQPLSYHTFHPSPLSGPMKAGASLLESSAMWDMAYGAQPIRIGAADLSSGSSGYQSGTSHTGSDLMKEHLREIRSLRQRLEDSIQTNDRLRQQLEERLVNQARDKGAPTNIYIQGLDSVRQFSSEIRALKEENLSLQARLQQASRDGSKEAEQLREAVLLGRTSVKEAELETERWAEQGRRLQKQTQAQNLEIIQLKQDRQNNQEAIKRLQQEVNVLQQQVCESRGLIHSLQYKLQIYHRVCGVPKNTHTDPAISPPVRDTGLFTPASSLSPTLEPQDTDSSLEGQAPDGSFANRNGCHSVGHVDDFRALQQQVLEGRALIDKMEAALRATANHALLELSLDKPVDPGLVRRLLTSTKTLRQIFEEASSLLRMFWRAALPSCEGYPQSTKELSLKEEVHTLRQRISQQEEALRDAVETLKSSDRTKDSMEHFIVSQLSRTKDVLKKARTNLEVKTQEASVSSPSLLVGVW